jgi:hypothetical protein
MTSTTKKAASATMKGGKRLGRDLPFLLRLRIFPGIHAQEASGVGIIGRTDTIARVSVKLASNLLALSHQLRLGGFAVPEPTTLDLIAGGLAFGWATLIQQSGAGCNSAIRAIAHRV